MPVSTRDLTDTVVAITGASSGIGAASARQLLEAGAKVVVQARRRERLDALVSEFGADNALVVVGDVQNPASALRAGGVNYAWKAGVLGSTP